MQLDFLKFDRSYEMFKKLFFLLLVLKHALFLLYSKAGWSNRLDLVGILYDKDGLDAGRQQCKPSPEGTGQRDGAATWWKHHRRRFSRFSYNFDPNQKVEIHTVWCLPPSDRFSSESTLHAVDFSCRSMASTRYQHQRTVPKSPSKVTDRVRCYLLRCSDGKRCRYVKGVVIVCR